MDNAEFYKLELTANTFEVSVYAVFWSAFKVEGYIVPDSLIEEHFGRYLRTQEVPQQVLSFCSKVLEGKCAFVYNDESAALLA